MIGKIQVAIKIRAPTLKGNPNFYKKNSTATE